MIPTPQKPLRIAFYSTFILEYGGGLEKYLIETASHLASRKNVVADVITMDDAFMSKLTDAQSVFYMKKIDKRINYKEDIKNIEMRLGSSHYYKMSDFKKLRKKLQSYDVIYCKNELIESFILKFFVGYRNLPSIVFGGHTPLQYPDPQSFHARLHNFLYGSMIYQFLASGVKQFHAINEYETKLYARLFPHKKVTKIYNPFDIKKFKELSNQYVYDGFRESPLAINILWVGRLTEQKGVLDLVKVIDGVNRRLSKGVVVAWHVFGDGELKPLIEGLAKRHKNVQHHGHVDQKYMSSIYSQGQIALSTSKWEGYPYSLIESQTFGLQGFAYNIPGPTDIFSAYKGGHIVETVDDMTDALTSVLEKYKHRKAVPVSVASNQFEPERIYSQIISMLQGKGK